MKFARTATLLRLARKADRAKRNQRFDVEFLVPRLDPDGVHIVAKHFLHNEFEVRTVWFLKFNSQDAPVTGVLDLTVEEFNKLKDVKL